MSVQGFPISFAISGKQYVACDHGLGRLEVSLLYLSDRA